jgi:DNA polymerase III epsilon subunit family exonuclease
MKGFDPLALIAFDLETTGLNPSKAEIIEIGAVKFTIDGSVLDRFEQLCRPRAPIPGEIIKTTGITNEMVSNAPPLHVALGRFVEWVGTEDVILVAHNASFDSKFLTASLVRIGLPIPKWGIVDTLQWSFGLKIPLKDFRLATILEALDQPISPHRALADTEGVVTLVRYLTGDYTDPEAEIRRRKKSLEEAAGHRIRFPRRQFTSALLSDTDPATDRQLKYLRYLKVPEDQLEGLSKRAASELIDRYK